MTDPLFLFDISAYLHRAMYVSYGDRVSDIEPTDTNFVKHACGMLANTMEKLNVKRMALVCDSTEPSFRCDDYPAYKAERKAHYPVFTAQAPYFFDMMREMSVAVVAEPRYEADDLIASLVYMKLGPVVVVSSDKDLLTLLGLATPGFESAVRYYDPMKNIWITAIDVKTKFGVDAYQLYDYTALVGDSSDGIPGVAGFGAKTAAKLLREFETLDDIYDPDRRVALGEFATPKQLATLLASKDVAFLSRKLAVPYILPAWQTPWTAGDFDAPAPGIVRKACG